MGSEFAADTQSPRHQKLPGLHRFTFRVNTSCSFGAAHGDAEH